jgi:hypothetical protein
VRFPDILELLVPKEKAVAWAGLHDYAPLLYSHVMTTFRPISDPPSLPPASGRTRP